MGKPATGALPGQARLSWAGVFHLLEAAMIQEISENCDLEMEP